MEDALLDGAGVTQKVRDFYIEMRKRKRLPQAREQLGNQSKQLRRSYRIFMGEEKASAKHRALHTSEVRLLALLHDAGLPVLGDDNLGAVKPMGGGSWRWELAGVLG